MGETGVSESILPEENVNSKIRIKHRRMQIIIFYHVPVLAGCAGGVKLGSSGERGALAPPKTLDPSLQDRGFLVSDNLFTGIPREFSSANPIFAACVV
jgi:hypothetical protein